MTSANRPPSRGSPGPDPHGDPSEPGPAAIPLWLRAFLTLVLPADRREEMIGDLLQTLRRRTTRLGRGEARRLLLRDAVSLIGWRFRDLPAAPTTQRHQPTHDPALRRQR